MLVVYAGCTHFIGVSEKPGTPVEISVSATLASFIVGIIFAYVHCSCCCCFGLYALLSHLCNELMYKD